MIQTLKRMSEKKYYIGMDLGGTNIKASLYTADFKQIDEMRAPTEAKMGSGIVLDRMKETIGSLLVNNNLVPEEVLCMGMGIPGLMDREKGISFFSPNFQDWENVPIVEWFQNEFGIPTYIDNDARVNLYGEWYFGAGKGKNNVFLLTLGTGLGAAVIIDGHVLYGATGNVGEIGHMNMYREGRPCRCGSSGCLGRYVSALGLVNTVKEKIRGGETSILAEWTKGNLENITASMISEAYDLNDWTAVAAMHETGEILGFGLVNVMNLYNPEIIIIGGGMSAAGERLLKRARTIVNERAIRISCEACKIVTASLGDSAGMLGAAVYASTRHRLV